MKRLALGVVIGALICAGGAVATDYGFVPFGPNQTVSISPTALGTTALSLHSFLAGSNLAAFNYTGAQVLTIANNGELLVKDGDSGRTVGGISSVGGLITAENYPPDGGVLAKGEARLWFDKTPVTGGLSVTYKDSAGTVRTVRLG